MDIISLLSADSYIICNKTLLRLFGADAAILIGELCAEYKYYTQYNQLTEDGMFFSTQDNIEFNTGINAYSQRKALKKLESEGIITITKKGLPAKNYFKINEDKLLKIFTASNSNFKGLEVENLNINNNNIKIINKNNTDISKDISDSESSSDTFQFGKPKQTKPNLYQKCLAIINDYTEDNNIRKMLIEYLDLLLEKSKVEHKPLYANQFKGMLKHLNDLIASKENGTIEDIISQSIQKSYIGFFPVTNNNYIQQKQQGYRLPPQKEAKPEDFMKDENGNYIVY